MNFHYSAYLLVLGFSFSIQAMDFRHLAQMMITSGEALSVDDKARLSELDSLGDNRSEEQHEETTFLMFHRQSCGTFAEYYEVRKRQKEYNRLLQASMSRRWRMDDKIASQRPDELQELAYVDKFDIPAERDYLAGRGESPYNRPITRSYLKRLIEETKAGHPITDAESVERRERKGDFDRYLSLKKDEPELKFTSYHHHKCFSIE